MAGIWKGWRIALPFVASFMDLIVKTKNKKEEKIVQAFLSSLDIDYHSEAQEDKALYKAMSEGRKTRKLTAQERARFLKILGSE